ncbi:MAG TPA: HEPN domain-containing protein [Gemmataceae bacterium]|jgi:HEPN domain-containing protein
MQPTTPRDFLKVALQRLTAAEEIMETLRLTLEAQYIGGYSVECSLKALILEKTAEPDRPAMLDQLTHGATYHRPEVLLDRLRERGVFLTVELAKRMRRFDWRTDLRYETGRKDTGETNGLLRTARAIYEWVEGQIS